MFFWIAIPQEKLSTQIYKEILFCFQQLPESYPHYPHLRQGEYIKKGMGRGIIGGYNFLLSNFSFI